MSARPSSYPLLLPPPVRNAAGEYISPGRKERHYTNPPRKPLADLLSGENRGKDEIWDRFDSIEAAEDFGPLSKGVYVALAVGGRLDKARTGRAGTGWNSE